MMTLDEAIQHCEEISCEHSECALEHKQLSNWLKELKNLKRKQTQNTWKPSDEQMVALDGICSYIRNKADWEISQDMVSDLYKLSEQLKKLKN